MRTRAFLELDSAREILSSIIGSSNSLKVSLLLDIRADLVELAVMEVAPNANTATEEAIRDQADLIREVPAHTELQAHVPTHLVPDNLPGVPDIELYELRKLNPQERGLSQNIIFLSVY